MSTQSQTAPQRPRTLPANESTRKSRPDRRLNATGFTPWAVVLLTPAVGVLLLRAPLVNMLGTLDPWLYAGYGWTLAHHVTIFGWPYYADRFTVILPIAVSTGLLGPLPAYLVLHYLLMAGCGATLYLAVRRYASLPVAAGAVCLLMLNPFFVRLMGWDYSPFVMVSCTIAGAALWYLGATWARALWTALAAGILLSAAIYADPGAGLVLPALLGVEAIAAIRGSRRDVLTLVLRGCAMAAGALLVVVVGYLGYRAYIGSFPVKLMFQATIDFIRAGNKYTLGYQVAPSIFLRTDPYIYAPVLVCLGTVMVLGRSLLSNTLRTRMAQFAIAYTLVIWVYRFAANSDVVEVWFFYYQTAVTVAFAVPAMLDELGRPTGRARWRMVAGVAVAATGLTDLVVRSLGQSVITTFAAHTLTIVCILIAIFIAAVVVALWKQGAARLIAVAVFCASLAAVGLAPSGTNDFTGEFSRFGTTAELRGLQAGYDMAQLIAKYDRPTSRVVLWDDLRGLGSAGWVNIGGHLDTYGPPPIPTLTPSELATLREPIVTRVLAVSQSVDQIASAVPALQKHGFAPALETEGVWTGGHLYYALIKLHASP